LPAIRPATVAGAFYPAAAIELERQIGIFLDNAGRGATASAPKALIAPHAGYIYSRQIAAAAYARLVPARGRMARVVVLGPSHFVGFSGLAVSSAEAWQTPLGRVPVDRPVTERLVAGKLVDMLDAAHAREHSLEVQIPFLQTAVGQFSLVPIVAGDSPPEAVAALLDAVWGGPETLIVISTDLLSSRLPRVWRSTYFGSSSFGRDRAKGQQGADELKGSDAHSAYRQSHMKSRFGKLSPTQSPFRSKGKRSITPSVPNVKSVTPPGGRTTRRVTLCA
jgi:hypothetical protein